ncbi:universal stress protein [Maribacter ulvicola]|uniref:Nucleotide-binding universal stress protein, UspA family n=1 Tax=Maribacter ulvicola TaxID=228959 RepID=A0A1N6ZAB2_9FLAO|nr:universal stress protein [Maribacter ulvicola]SIR23764.1 Nucleotide-binding universal stress protein, UspA family [Maribacter ulvicola]
MKNILIPTDFSSAAWNATQYALQLFAESECIFHFLNAYTPEMHSNRLMAGKVLDTVKGCSAQSASEKGLRKTLGQIKKEYNNPLHTYTAISTFSMLVDEVKEVVEEHRIDYIIMSTSGGADDETIFLGRNTVRILNHGYQCPIMVIPPRVRFENLQAISLISEYNHLFKGDELNPMIDLARYFNSGIQIASMHKPAAQVTELQQLNHEFITERLRGIYHNFYKLDSENSLKSYVDQTNCQLLVLSNNANSYLRNLCHDYIVGRSTFCCHVPILSLQHIENNISINC